MTEEGGRNGGGRGVRVRVGGGRGVRDRPGQAECSFPFVLFLAEWGGGDKGVPLWRLDYVVEWMDTGRGPEKDKIM